MNGFCDYFVKTYVEETAPIQSHVWADLSSSAVRTTNGCESFHAKVNSMLYTFSPNLYQIIESLKNVQCEMYIKVRSTQNPPKEILAKQQFLKEQIIFYKNGVIGFVEALSKKFCAKSTCITSKYINA